MRKYLKKIVHTNKQMVNTNDWKYTHLLAEKLFAKLQVPAILTGSSPATAKDDYVCLGFRMMNPYRLTPEEICDVMRELFGAIKVEATPTSRISLDESGLNPSEITEVNKLEWEDFKKHPKVVRKESNVVVSVSGSFAVNAILH